MTDTTAVNPLLEDDEDEFTVTNPMLDEDEDETVAAPTRPLLNLPSKAPAQTPAAPKVLKVGDKGYNLGGKHPHKGTPRAHATANDAPGLAFMYEVKVVDLMTFSMALRTAASPISVGGRMPSEGGARKKLVRLERLGLVESVYSRDDGKQLWGVTEAGISAAQRYGFILDDNLPSWKSIKDMKRKTLAHSRAIGTVAAHLMAGHYKESLGIGAVDFKQLVSEDKMRRDQKSVSDAVKVREDTNFGIERRKTVAAARAELEAGTLDRSHLFLKYPELLVMGYSKDFDDGNFIHEHWADLVVLLDRTPGGPKGKNVMIEVELNKKGWVHLRKLFNTYVKEFQDGTVFERVIYVVHWSEVENLIRAVDKDGKFGLIKSGRLVITSLTDRYGNPVGRFDKLGD